MATTTLESLSFFLHSENMTSPLFILASWRWPCLPPPTPLLCAHESLFFTLHTQERHYTILSSPFFRQTRQMKAFHPLYLTPFHTFFPHSSTFLLFFFLSSPKRQPAPSTCVPARLFTHHSQCSITISAIVALDHGLHLLFTPLSLLRCFNFLLFPLSLERREEKKECYTSSDQIGGGAFFPSSFFHGNQFANQCSVRRECCQVV